MQEKKIFSPTLTTYNNNLSKRWRWEWYETPIARKPKVQNVAFRKDHTLEQRQKAAQEAFERIKLPNSPSSTRVKFKSQFERAYAESETEWRAKTESTNRTIRDRYLKFLKYAALADVATSDTICSFLTHCRTEYGAKNSTISKYRVTLSGIYSKAIKRGFLKIENPVKGTDAPKKSPKSKSPFSDAQVARLMAYDWPQQMRVAIKLLYACFIRNSELRLMKIEHINFDFGYIELPSDVSKNKKVQKIVIPAWLLKEIDYLKNYPNNHYVLSRNGGPGTEVIGKNKLNYEHRKVLDILKIKGNYSFYSWKHTGVIRAVKAGINMKDLQMQLRHHSLDMVAEYMKDLGVLDSDDLRERFPPLNANPVPVTATPTVGMAPITQLQNITSLMVGWFGRLGTPAA